MTKYELMAETIQEKLSNGEITLEDANVLNDMAYEKYADQILTEDDLYDESDEDVTLGDVLAYIESSISDAEEEAEYEEGAVTTDDINDMIDRVTVAYESGVISEEDALGYLELLDMDNYE